MRTHRNMSCALWWALRRRVMACAVAAIGAGVASGQCQLHQTDKLVGVGRDCGLSGCRQGFSAAVSGDGLTAIVGAQGESIFTGAAYAYTRVNGAWVQQTRLTPIGGQGQNQYFGCSAAISFDGNTALVGAYGDSSSLGAVYAYSRVGGVWTQTAKLRPTGSISLPVYFGVSLALSANGNTAIIGADGDNGYGGAAYVFTRSGGAWTQQQRLTGAGTIGVVVHYGNAVALSADGSTALVGAYADNFFLGAAFFYARSGNTFTQQGPKFTALSGVGTPLYFGSSVALNADGTIGLVGSLADSAFTGAVYAHRKVAGAWSQAQKIAPTGAADPGRFGSTMAMSQDGNVAIVGGPSDNGYVGAAYLLARDATTGVWTQSGAKMVPSNAAGSGSFGTSIAADAWAKTIALGAPGDAGALGAGYLIAEGQKCTGDFNCSGAVNIQDVLDFLTAWYAGDRRANFNGVNGCTTQDIFDFLNVWFWGC